MVRSGWFRSHLTTFVYLKDWQWVYLKPWNVHVHGALDLKRAFHTTAKAKRIRQLPTSKDLTLYGIGNTTGGDLASKLADSVR